MSKLEPSSLPSHGSMVAASTHSSQDQRPHKPPEYPFSIYINWEQCSSAPAPTDVMIIRYRGAQHISTPNYFASVSISILIEGQTFEWNILTFLCTFQSWSQVIVETVHVKTAAADALVPGAVLISARSRGAVPAVWRFEATIKPSKKCPDEFFMSI